MAMTIGSWQKELHLEQIALEKIIKALRKKKDYRNAEKLQKLRERLARLVYQPMPAGHSGRMPGVMDPMKFMEYMYPKLDKIVKKIGRNNFDKLLAVLDRQSAEQLRCLMTFLTTQLIGGGGMTMEGKVSGAEVVLEKDNVDCPCGSVTQINAKIVNTGSVKDSFSVEFSEGGVDSNLVIEAWAECGKTTPELKPGECYELVINIKPACSAFGVSQVGLSDRIRITVESVLDEVDKDSKYLKVNVK
ncbi:MAG: hypothetical protein L6265_02410 [Thermoplasmatales archaeon]|nr:hypothetical protein [Thermoplasmatales archaeon]